MNSTQTTSSDNGTQNKAHNGQGSEQIGYKEGPIAKTIEQQTKKIPSDVFLWSALAAMATSAALQVMDKKKLSNFIGEWVPTLLLFGVYNKIVKVMGSESYEVR